MVDERYENRLAATVRRCYPVLLAAIALAISGCATTAAGPGQQTDRQFREDLADSSHRPDLAPDVTQGIQSRDLNSILHR